MSSLPATPSLSPLTPEYLQYNFHISPRVIRLEICRDITNMIMSRVDKLNMWASTRLCPSSKRKTGPRLKQHR